MSFAEACNPDYWRKINPHLNISVKGEPLTASPMDLSLETQDAEWKRHLVDEGYLQMNSVIPDRKASDLKTGILAIRQDGWIPLFAFVYDEYWNLFRSLRSLIQPILGDKYCMLPDFWIWYVDPEKKEAGWAPHRDKTINTLFPDGMPKSATVWVALTEANPLNGCMYLIPANQDPNYLNFSDTSKGMNFQAIRALCAPTGSVLLWNQRVIHWGGSSCDRATGPRISMAFEFQRGDVPPYNQPLLDVATLPSFNYRLKLIGKQILQYAHMYKYSDELVKTAREMFEIKEDPAQDAPTTSRKIGRNEPCPCGSGKKYKHCHGENHP